jgi:hypothetical protein
VKHNQANMVSTLRFNTAVALDRVGLLQAACAVATSDEHWDIEGTVGLLHLMVATHQGEPWQYDASAALTYLVTLLDDAACGTECAVEVMAS